MPPGIPGLSRLAIDPMAPPHWLCLFVGHDSSPLCFQSCPRNLDIHARARPGCRRRMELPVQVVQSVTFRCGKRLNSLRFRVTMVRDFWRAWPAINTS